MVHSKLIMGLLFFTHLKYYNAMIPQELLIIAFIIGGIQIVKILVKTNRKLTNIEKTGEKVAGIPARTNTQAWKDIYKDTFG